MADRRPVLVEALGTGLMVLAGGGAIVAGLAPWLVAAAFGGSVAALVFLLGPVSGAHFNPAVTVAFAATGRFPRRRVAAYVAAQVLGAFLACAALATVSDLAPVAAGGPARGWTAVGLEVAATFLLAFAIAAVASDRRVPAGAAAFAIGLAVFVGALAAGAAMNPARAFAPALLSWRLASLGPAIVGSFLGGPLGMAAFEGLRWARTVRSQTRAGPAPTATPVPKEADA